MQDMTFLHVDSSILGERSVSRQLSAAIVAQLRAQGDRRDYVYRDLAAEPIAHLSGALLAAAQQDSAGELEPGLRRDLEQGAAALEEFLAADIVVIGAPMYNFTVPTQLKAWIDRLAVAGRTFRYTESGSEGLAGGKRVIVAATRGGFYGPGTPAEAAEHQESYLRAMFGFFGITDITFVRAEGAAIGPEFRARAIDGALAEIADMAPTTLAA